MTAVTEDFLKDIKNLSRKTYIYKNEYAKKLNTTWSKMRTAFERAEDLGYIEYDGTTGGIHRFRRTRKKVKV